MSRHSSRNSAWTKTRARILHRDAHTCGYCGREATTVDHIIARANGGTDEDANLIACCTPCNSSKGAKVITRTNYYDPEWLTHV